MDYDAVIVGAGPAGCAAAFDLASAGRSVLLLDRFESPRAKPCAGALTPKTVQALRYSVAPVIRHVCTNLVIARRGDHAHFFRGRHTICAMTVRSEFDDFCLRKTLAAGACFQTVAHLHAITEHAGHVSLSTDRGPFAARFVIGADGANSQVRRLSGLFPSADMAFGLETHLPLAGMARPEMSFHLGVVPRGYGWVFPKDDHVNVGLYTCSPSVRPRREQLAEYVDSQLGRTALDHVVGHQVGLGGWRYRPASNRIFLVGDAAGLVDPLLGEGIYNAIKSGQAAAAAILRALTLAEPALETFRRLLRPLQRDVASGFRSARLVYRHLRLGCLTVTFPLVRYSLMKGYAAGVTFSFIKRFFYVLPFLRVPEAGPLSDSNVRRHPTPVTSAAPLTTHRGLPP